MNCRCCKIELTIDNWANSLKKKNSTICKKCHLDKNREWRKKNREKSNEYGRMNYKKNKSAFHERVKKHRKKIRIEILSEYGGKCIKCGINDLDVLDIDHIYNDGAEDRKKNLFAYNLYRELKKQGYPKDRHQILCKNCNWKKEIERRKLNSLSDI